MSIDLWAEQIQEFCKYKVISDFVLVGNSIGSLVAVTMAARENEDSKLKGVYLVNCAGGMNGLHVLNGHPPTTLFEWMIVLITNMLKHDAVNNFLFDKIRVPSTVKEVLT